MDNKNEPNDDPNKIVKKPLEKANDYLLKDNAGKTSKVKNVTKKSEKSKRNFQRNKNVRVISKNKRLVRNARKKYLLKIKKEATSEKRLTYVRSQAKKRQNIKRNFRRLSNNQQHLEQQIGKNDKEQTQGTLTRTQQRNRNRQRNLQRLNNQKTKESIAAKERLKSLNRKKATIAINSSQKTAKTKLENIPEKAITKKQKRLILLNRKKVNQRE